MWVAGLPVVGQNVRPMSLEPRPNDPGERRVDNPKPHPFPGLHGYEVGNSSIYRDGVADTARHARFHAITDAGSDPSVVIEPPVLDHPRQVAIDRDRLAFLDNQCAGKPGPSCCSVSACG